MLMKYYGTILKEQRELILSQEQQGPMQMQILSEFVVGVNVNLSVEDDSDPHSTPTEDDVMELLVSLWMRSLDPGIMMEPKGRGEVPQCINSEQAKMGSLNVALGAITKHIIGYCTQLIDKEIELEKIDLSAAGLQLSAFQRIIERG
eukprot:jgi/Psemu1/3449/gm1.3449_g